MKMFKAIITQVQGQKEPLRSSIGGYPILAQDEQWPTCKICGEELVLFFQFDITADYNTPFEVGSHLSVFMCANHDDIPNYEVKPNSKFPENYWEDDQKNYHIVFNRPGVKEQIHSLEQHLVYSSLEFEEADEEVEEVGPPNKRFNIGLREFKIGGTPSWTQDPKNCFCSCGAEMKFICQVPEEFLFEIMPGVTEQPNSYTDKAYMLFLGNEIYFFACEKQCHPLAVFAIL